MPEISPLALELLERCDPAANLGQLNSRLRAEGHESELVVWVLGQLELRQRAKAKLGAKSQDLLFTRAGLEQASRWEVASYHAQRVAKFKSVTDLGCGLGIDSLAFAEAGLQVVAIEQDPEVAQFAAFNLKARPDATVLTARAEDHQITTEAVWLDPARRDLAANQRSRKMLSASDFSPPLDFAVEQLRARPGGIKLAPGLPLELVPDDLEATWVSHRGDLVELSLWSVDPERMGQRFAVQLGVNGQREFTGPNVPADVGPLERFVAEPDPALIRSGLLGAFAKQHGLSIVANEIAYLTASERPQSPWLRSFEVLEQLPLDAKQIKKRLSEMNIGKLEIKKRGVDVNPDEFRKKLLLKGEGAATLILTRVGDARRALVCVES